MKKLLLLTLFAATALSAFSQSKPIKKPGRAINWFHGTYGEFQSQMIDKGKPAVILVISGGHAKSKEFEANLNKDTELISFIDSNYVAFKVDASQNYDVPMELRITDIPSLVVMDRNFKISARLEGKKEPDGLMDLLEAAK